MVDGEMGAKGASVAVILKENNESSPGIPVLCILRKRISFEYFGFVWYHTIISPCIISKNFLDNANPIPVPPY